jgi:hypothetical protein
MIPGSQLAKTIADFIHDYRIKLAVDKFKR